MIDWFFEIGMYLIGLSLIFLIGVIGILWGLWGDRSKGRARRPTLR